MNQVGNDNFSHITEYIFVNHSKPSQLGIEKGLDVSAFYLEKVKLYSSLIELIDDLQRDGFIVRQINQIEIVAVKHHITSGVIKRIDVSVCLNFHLEDGVISLKKATFFRNSNI